MIFRINPSAGEPIYLQLMQQVRHAVETGVVQLGDELPGIRTLAKELIVSHNTVAKAYTELEHEGIVELRQGSGAYVSAVRTQKPPPETVRTARVKTRALVESLRRQGLSDEEIHRVFEAELFYAAPAEKVKG
jgi:GntR family transcriptional regulator